MSRILRLLFSVRRWTPVLALVGVGAACALTPPRAPAPTAGAAFVDVAVIPLDTQRVLLHQTVVVQGRRITALGPANRVTVPAGALRIEGRGRYLVPGLADMHTHLSYGGTAHAERHLLLALAAGITTVRNMDFMPNRTFRDDYQPFKGSRRLDGPGLLRLKARTASGELLGPRIYTSAPWYLDSTRSIDANVAAYKAAGYDHIKWYMEDSVTTDSLAAAAHRLGVPLVGHGFEGVSGGLARTLALGFKSIEHLVPYPVGGPGTPSWQRPEDSLQLPAMAAATARAGVWNSPSPIGSRGQPGWLERHYGAAERRLLFGTEPDSGAIVMMTRPPTGAPSADERVYLERTGRVIKALRDAGAGLLLGTDSPVWGILPGSTLHRQLQTAVEVGLTPYEALAAVTRNPAAYFGTLDSTGTVTVGKRADLLLLDANPLEEISRSGDIAGVMVGGRWVSRYQGSGLGGQEASDSGARFLDHQTWFLPNVCGEAGEAPPAFAPTRCAAAAARLRQNGTWVVMTPIAFGPGVFPQLGYDHTIPFLPDSLH